MRPSSTRGQPRLAVLRRTSSCHQIFERSYANTIALSNIRILSVDTLIPLVRSFETVPHAVMLCHLHLLLGERANEALALTIRANMSTAAAPRRRYPGSRPPMWLLNPRRSAGLPGRPTAGVSSRQAQWTPRLTEYPPDVRGVRHPRGRRRRQSRCRQTLERTQRGETRHRHDDAWRRRGDSALETCSRGRLPASS
jgi:hypothetical protein